MLKDILLWVFSFFYLAVLRVFASSRLIAFDFGFDFDFQPRVSIFASTRTCAQTIFSQLVFFFLAALASWRLGEKYFEFFPSWRLGVLARNRF
ncbi:MAG: hypothetical protein ACNA7J_05865 [Wenzhouxiangella sp.]